MSVFFRLCLASALGALAGACFDEDLTLKDECLDGADCGPGQACSQTPYQTRYALPGWCRLEEDSCFAGEQPGCDCSANQGCSGTGLTAVPAACIDATTDEELETCISGGMVAINDCVCVFNPVPAAPGSDDA